jgi:TIR domain/WD domain, G-beta repeat
MFCPYSAGAPWGRAVDSHELRLMADSAVPSEGGVFISYRREETRWQAGWLYDRLVDRFGSSQIFKDIDSIQLGADFVEEITTAVGSCDVLLALIGDQWLTITDTHGRPRLDNPKDLVRVEIEAALTRHVRVIPILIEGARMPDPDQLPPSLAKLTDRHALELSPSHFESGTSQLLSVINSTLADAATRARREAEEQARRDAEERARREADEQARRDAEERPRREADEQARHVRRTLMPKTSRARMILAGIITLLIIASVISGVLLVRTSSHPAHTPVGTGTVSVPPSTTIPFAATRKRVLSIPQANLDIRSVAFNGNSTIAAGASDGTTRLWNVDTGKSIPGPPDDTNDKGLTAAAFSPRGTWLASGTLDGKIWLWNPQTGVQKPDPLTTPGSSVKGLAFSPRGEILASAGSDGEVHFWDTSTWTPTDPLRASDKTVEGIAFSPRGDILATGSWDDMVNLWEAASPHNRIATLPGHAGWVLTVAFSHDGSILASASSDNTVRLWNVDKHESSFTLGIAKGVIGVAFSPVANILASSGYDGWVRLWDATTGKALGKLGDGKAIFGRVAFSPDGKTLASGTNHSSVWLWAITYGNTSPSPTH